MVTHSHKLAEINVMEDAFVLMIPLGVMAFGYYVVFRTMPHIPTTWRRRIIFGYATIHLLGWLIMHLQVSIPFSRHVREEHSQAWASIPVEIERYKSWEPNPDPNYIESLKRRVSARPWYRVWSVSPCPFILLTSENYSIGPLWALGMVRVYAWQIISVKQLFEGRMWIS